MLPHRARDEKADNSMPRALSDQRPPDTAPRIVVRHLGGRTWSARAEGRGSGIGWGCVLAELDCLAEAHTATSPPTYYLDRDRMRRLRIVCASLGVPVQAADGATLPMVRVR